MEKQDIKRFTETMLALAENYPGANVTSNGLKFRFEALKGYSIDDITRAATRLIREHRFNTMPTTGDMIRAMDTAGGMPPEHRAEIEAGKILDHLHRNGATRSPRLEDPITRHLMTHRWSYRAWAAVVRKSDLQWWRRDFIRAYMAQAAMVEGGGFIPAGLPIGELAQDIARGGNPQRG